MVNNFQSNPKAPVSLPGSPVPKVNPTPNGNNSSSQFQSNPNNPQSIPGKVNSLPNQSAQKNTSGGVTRSQGGNPNSDNSSSQFSGSVTESGAGSPTITRTIQNGMTTRTAQQLDTSKGFSGVVQESSNGKAQGTGYYVNGQRIAFNRPSDTTSPKAPTTGPRQYIEFSNDARQGQVQSGSQAAQQLPSTSARSTVVDSSGTAQPINSSFGPALYKQYKAEGFSDNDATRLTQLSISRKESLTKEAAVKYLREEVPNNRGPVAGYVLGDKGSSPNSIPERVAYTLGKVAELPSKIYEQTVPIITSATIGQVYGNLGRIIPKEFFTGVIQQEDLTGMEKKPVVGSIIVGNTRYALLSEFTAGVRAKEGMSQSRNSLAQDPGYFQSNQNINAAKGITNNQVIASETNPDTISDVTTSRFKNIVVLDEKTIGRAGVDTAVFTLLPAVGAAIYGGKTLGKALLKGEEATEIGGIKSVLPTLKDYAEQHPISFTGDVIAVAGPVVAKGAKAAFTVSEETLPQGVVRVQLPSGLVVESTETKPITMQLIEQRRQIQSGDTSAAVSEFQITRSIPGQQVLRSSPFSRLFFEPERINVQAARTDIVKTLTPVLVANGEIISPVKVQTQRQGANLYSVSELRGVSSNELTAQDISKLSPAQRFALNKLYPQGLPDKLEFTAGNLEITKLARVSPKAVGGAEIILPLKGSRVSRTEVIGEERPIELGEDRKLFETTISSKDITNPLNRQTGTPIFISGRVIELKPIDITPQGESEFYTISREQRLQRVQKPVNPKDLSTLQSIQGAASQTFPKIPTRAPTASVGIDLSNEAEVPLIVSGLRGTKSVFSGQGRYEVTSSIAAILPNIRSQSLQSYPTTNLGSTQGNFTIPQQRQFSFSLSVIKTKAASRNDVQQVQNNAQVIKPAEAQVSKASQNTRLEQQLKLQQQLKFQNKIGLHLPPYQPTFKRPKEEILKLPKLELPSRDNPLGVEGYRSYIKVKGRRVLLPGVREKGSAVRFGEIRTLRDVAATFGVIDTGKKIQGKESRARPNPTLFRDFKVKAGKAVPLTNEFIQRKGKRLSNRSEVSNLLSYRRRK